MIQHPNPSHISRKFEEPEEAALWLSDRGFTINNGQIQIMGEKEEVTSDEKELILWLHENDYYEYMSEMETLDRKRRLRKDLDVLDSYFRSISSSSWAYPPFKV